MHEWISLNLGGILTVIFYAPVLPDVGVKGET